MLQQQMYTGPNPVQSAGAVEYTDCIFAEDRILSMDQIEISMDQKELSDI